jgi:predicted RNase H-like nuclease
MSGEAGRRRLASGESGAFYVGVDGCKEGWFAVALADGGWHAGVFPDVASLWERFRGAALILIDVPIGLRDCGPEERTCDREARRFLGPERASSVFPAPCRAAVYADSYHEASKINQRLTGRRLSRQAWGIARKIREVDEFLTQEGKARLRIRETHPEVCFWALAGRPMKHPKKTGSGFEERLEVLRSAYPGVDVVVQGALSVCRYGQVARDDVLDALVAAVSASMGTDRLCAVPMVAEYDRKSWTRFSRGA